MLVTGSYEKAKQYLESRTKDFSDYTSTKSVFEQGPCITISRETGSGAGEVAESLIEYLKSRSKTQSVNWGIFDRNLIEKIIEDHKLPKSVADYLSEDKTSFIRSMMNEIFGIHPSMLNLVHKTTRTILNLARMGNVIIIGRGANLITKRLENVFHVRLVAPLEKRIQTVMKYYDLNDTEAQNFIKKEDQARTRYVKKYFNLDPCNPDQYHLVINTGLFTTSEAAEIIGTQVVRRFPEQFYS
ncbi:MAG: cytidylate kinase-like family protein [Bacteroidetes bacterium]|nr:cytidylate kinase-like family protein [Bacteroidota bacterium]MBU2586287.1 cytidylate kinase-like family protein [Bacteroidota bacterium]